MSPSVGVIIPWRTDNGTRERLWRYVKGAWERTGIPFYAASDGLTDGQVFNRSAARNNAFELSTEDIVITSDADHIPQPDAVADAAKRVVEGEPWTAVYLTNGVFDPVQTSRIIEGWIDPLTTEPQWTAPFCTSLLAMRREVWEDVGGQNERFHGWGCEDVEFRAILQALYPLPVNNATRRNLCLFHETAKEPVTWEHNLGLEQAFENGPLAQGPQAMREYVEQGKHDGHRRRY